MNLLNRTFLTFSAVLLLAAVVLFSLDNVFWAKITFIGFWAFLSIASNGNEIFKRFTFGLWVLTSVSFAMCFPELMKNWGTFNTKALIVPLMQLIMFGMGTAMSVKDFVQVIQAPKAVLIGLVCQFSIMPLVALTLVTGFGFPPEIAAGVILIGSSPSGLASNVMVFISKANLALSVTLTTVATLLAPLVTPMIMKVLAGEMIPIDVGTMMWGITKIVILPIIAGLVFNKLLHGKTEWLDDAMPKVSMAGIAVIIAVITAAGRDGLLEVGLALVFASLIHNCGGYVLGYWSCRLLKLDERSCRTIALEVGIQNGGLASGIALQMGKVATVGLASAVFGPMMNITGSMLASWWKEKPYE
ncbi:MAG: bile acid:sodium symporter family protein [Saprospiraceae bacterium]|nr:bile acid:sodium symporter family protein [Saprospiraceae bacterium]